MTLQLLLVYLSKEARRAPSLLMMRSMIPGVEATNDFIKEKQTSYSITHYTRSLKRRVTCAFSPLCVCISKAGLYQVSVTTLHQYYLCSVVNEISREQMHSGEHANPASFLVVVNMEG